MAGGGAKEQPTPDGAVTSEPLHPTVVARLKEPYGADLSDVTVRSGAGADIECAKQGCAALALDHVVAVSGKAGQPGSVGYNPATGDFGLQGELNF